MLKRMFCVIFSLQAGKGAFFHKYLFEFEYILFVEECDLFSAVSDAISIGNIFWCY